MANKELATRQKLRFRVEPSQNKPRNPYAALAKARAAGPHDKSRTTAERQEGKKLILKKLMGRLDE